MQTLSLAADFQATKKLKLNASFVYTKAEDDWEWTFAERASLGEVFIRKTSPASATPVTAGTVYDTAELNNLIDSYSDLSYEQYQITVGGTYAFTKRMYANASFTYDIFDMQEQYVYGDEDGTAYYGYVGVGWKF